MENQYVQLKDLTKRKYFDIFDGAMACVLFIALQFVAYMIMRLYNINSRLTYDLSSLLLQSCFVGAVLIISKIRNVDWISAANYNKKISGKTLLYVAGLTFICLYLFNDITTAFSVFLEKIGYSSVFDSSAYEQFTQITNGWEYLASIVSVCIIPPLCEEMLFRGAVLNSFRGLNKWLGIFVSGFCFMLMHGNPEQTIYQFALGLVLGYVAWETRNIWVCVLIHAFNNFLAITLQFVITLMSLSDGLAGSAEVEEYVYTWNDFFYYLIIGVAMCLVAVYFVKLLTKKLKEHLNKSNIISSETEQSPDMTIYQDGQVYSINDAKEEVQEKPNRAKTAWTAVAYIAFVAYFLYEWVGYLLYGLSITP